MVTVDTIQSLIQSLERVGNPDLKNEMQTKLTQVRGDLLALHEHLRTKDHEIRRLETQLRTNGNPANRTPGFVYDPPV